jgi:hypothetical protein
VSGTRANTTLIQKNYFSQIAGKIEQMLDYRHKSPFKLTRKVVIAHFSDWRAVKEALEASCNILELYGLVD